MEVNMRLALAGLLLVLTAVHLPTPANAQSMVAGTWSGSVTSPYGHSRPVNYRVAGTGDSLTITLTDSSGVNPVGFGELHLLGDTLRFTFAGGAQGSPVVCALVRQTGGVYEGSCKDSQRRQGRMRMVPPRKP